MNGPLFRNPTTRIRVGRQDYGVLLALQPHEIRAAVDAAASPAAQLALASPPSTAARPKAIGELDDVYLGNRRIVVAGGGQLAR